MFARLSLALVGVAGLLGGFFYDRSASRDGVHLVFLQVGQGDSTLLTSGEWTMLVDVGVKSDGFDAGERLVAPALRGRGIRTIDCLVLTHPDLDHIGGLGGLASRVRIGRVIVSRAFRNDPAMLDALSEARISPSQVEWVEGVLNAKIGDLDVEIVAPPWYSGVAANEASLFVRVDSGAGSVMMTGDANSSIEELMAADYDFDVQILKAGHHGSKTSTSTAWLEETTPEFVVASCGRRNNYGHPNPAVIERVNASGAKFLRTDRDGSVEFVLGAGGFARVR